MSSLSSFKSNFRSARNMTEKFRFSVTKIMVSWFEDTYIKCNSGSFIKLITEKISKRSPVFVARGQLRVILLINFLRLSKEVER